MRTLSASESSEPARPPDLGPHRNSVFPSQLRLLAPASRPTVDLELAEREMVIRARSLALCLGALLILAAIATALLATTWARAISPVGLLGSGVALIHFGGRPLDPLRAEADTNP